MMSHRWLYLLLLPALSFGQAAPSAPQTKPAQPPSASQPAKPAQTPEAKPGPAVPKPEANPAAVPDTAAVITLNGLCATKAAEPKPADCKTVITKAEFERTVSALTGQPIAQVPPQLRQQVASRLSQLMIVSHEAEKRGIANKPETQELLRFARMNALAQELGRSLQKQYEKSTPEEIQKFYDEHKAQFEEAKMKRIFIPKPRPEDNKPVDENAFKASADKIQQQAAAGEDFDKLEKQAFEAAGIKSPPPPTDLGAIRLANAPEAHKPAFQLKAGEVSQLLADAGGFYVYKMVSKQMVPLDQATPDIEKTLAAEKMEKAAQEITNSAQPVLNPSYFGPSAGPAPGQGMAKPPVSAPKPAPKPATETKAPTPPPK